MSAAPGRGEPPAILLGGRGPALSIARSLGRAGVPVHVLGDASAVVRHSRYCVAFSDLGAGEDVQPRWLQSLERGPRRGVVIPCHDDGLELIAHHRERLAGWGYLLPDSDDEVTLAMLDKERAYEVAREAGVPCPRTWPIGGEPDLRRALAEVEYPCAIKPRHSHRFVRRLHAKVLLARDEGELRSAAARAADEDCEVLVTEVVPGSDDRYCSYYTYMDAGGEPLLHFTKRKLRQHPPGFGLGTLHVTDWRPDVMEMGLRFLRGAGVRGIANVELKRDPRDGALKLIECNPRLTAANHLVYAAGLDLALLSYNLALGRTPPPLDGYRRGARTWYPVDDVRALAAYRRAGELRVRDWVPTVARRQHPPVLSRDDPRPGAVSGALRARTWWRRRRGRRRAR